MKANYYLKQGLAVAALLVSSTVFAQTAKETTMTEVRNPVIGSIFEKPEPGADEGSSPFAFGYECAAAWGDYNNDGFLDLITAGYGHSGRQTALYKNNGDGTFTYIAETPFPGLQSSNATWFDYNNDGNLDLFLAGSDGTSRYAGLWKNRGEAGGYEFEEVCFGQFAYINNEGGNRSNRYAVAADYDNDGWVDLYIQGWEQSGRRYSDLYKNINGEYFEAVQNATVNPVHEGESFIQMTSGGVTWGDYNKDGYLDLVTTGYWQGLNGADGGFITAIYTNNTDGTFTLVYYNKEGVTGDVIWMDYNNDGWLDYLIQGEGWLASIGGWTNLSSIFENNQEGGFDPTSIAPDNGMPQQNQGSVTNGDVNNDGFEDILFMKADPNALFLNNYADGTFTRQDFLYAGQGEDAGTQITLNGNRGGTACLADYDNDGDLDAFFAAYVDGRGEDGDPAEVKNRYQYSTLFRNDLGDDIPVNAPPTVPTNLQATPETGGGEVTFSWNASTDDLIESEAIRYNLFVKYGDVIMSILPAHLETGRLKVNETLAPLSTTSYKMSGLPADFTWGVQAIDNAKNASAFETKLYGDGGGTAIETPLAGKISIETEKGAIKVSANEAMEGSVEVFAVNGAKVYAAGTVNATAYLQAGVYIVKVTAQSGSLVKKVVLK